MDPEDDVEAPDSSAANIGTQRQAAGAVTDDGLPGSPVPGHPGLRVGVPGGNGVLRLYRSGGDAASGATLVPVAYYGLGAGGGPISEDGSWRAKNQEANTYDLYTAKRDLGEAQKIGRALGWGGYGQTSAAVVADQAAKRGLRSLAKPLVMFTNPEVGFVAGTIGQYMNEVDVPRLQNKIKELEAQKKRFERRVT